MHFWHAFSRDLEKVLALCMSMHVSGPAIRADYTRVYWQVQRADAAQGHVLAATAVKINYDRFENPRGDH